MPRSLYVFKTSQEAYREFSEAVQELINETKDDWEFNRARMTIKLGDSFKAYKVCASFSDCHHFLGEEFDTITFGPNLSIHVMDFISLHTIKR